MSSEVLEGAASKCVWAGARCFLAFLSQVKYRHNAMFSFFLKVDIRTPFMPTKQPDTAINRGSCLLSCLCLQKRMHCGMDQQV
jgi:hypothetical protein